MKGLLTREKYYVWRNQVLTHMDASDPEIAAHLRRMEAAKVEEVRRGDFSLPHVVDKALCSLFSIVWMTGKSGLDKFTRRGQGIVTWKLIYDEINKGK